MNLEDVEKVFVKTSQENSREIETSDSEGERGTKSRCSSADSSALLDLDDTSIEEEIADAQCNSRPTVSELQTKQGKVCNQVSNHRNEASEILSGLHDNILNYQSTNSEIDFVCTGIEANSNSRY